MSSNALIKGTTAKASPKRNPVFEGVRHCTHPGCITRISAYNGRDTCFLHSKFQAPRLRGKKVA